MQVFRSPGDRVSIGMDLTKNEHRVIDLLRELKRNKGYGTLRIEITAGVESLFRKEVSERPSEKIRC